MKGKYTKFETYKYDIEQKNELMCSAEWKYYNYTATGNLYTEAICENKEKDFKCWLLVFKGKLYKNDTCIYSLENHIMTDMIYENQLHTHMDDSFLKMHKAVKNKKA